MSSSKEQPEEKSLITKGILHIRLDQDLLNESTALAKKKGISLSGHVRMLLIQELDKDKAATKA